MFLSVVKNVYIEKVLEFPSVHLSNSLLDRNLGDHLRSFGSIYFRSTFFREKDPKVTFPSARFDGQRGRNRHGGNKLNTDMGSFTKKCIQNDKSVIKKKSGQTWDQLSFHLSTAESCLSCSLMEFRGKRKTFSKAYLFDNAQSLRCTDIMIRWFIWKVHLKDEMSPNRQRRVSTASLRTIFSQLGLL